MVIKGLLGLANLVEMGSNNYLFTNHNSFLLYITDEIKQKTNNTNYETNFGTACQTYKCAIKRNPSIRLQHVNIIFE